MADSFTGKRSDGRLYIVPDTVLVEKGDLVYYSSAEVFPASSQADQGSEPLNQQLFAQLFLGVSEDRSPSGTVSKITVDVDPMREWAITCPSGTWSVGDLVGASENATGDGLLDQQVEAVSDIAEAIGVCVKDEASAVTTVRCRLFSRIVGPLALTSAGVNVETLAATKTLDATSPLVQILDPDGAVRIVLMPAEAVAKGKGVYRIVNNATAGVGYAETMSIKEDSSTTFLKYLRPGESVELVSDGTNWHILSETFGNKAQLETVSSPGATLTITDAYMPVIKLTTDQNLTITLPAEGATNRKFVIDHTAGAGHTVLVNDDAAAAVITDIAIDEIGVVYPDGTNWVGHTGKLT